MAISKTLPVAVIGAGPVGLAAAARLIERGLEPLVFEQGATAGAAVAEWRHVRVFSPWRLNLDAAAQKLLRAEGWQAPDLDHLPTGAEIVRDYLAPLAAHPAIAPRLRTNARVLAVAREDAGKLESDGRAKKPFVIVWRDQAGRLNRSLARAVIDASGTWGQPNPIGRDGLPVEGEVENATRIAYGIPDVLGAARNDYAGRHTLVIGAGHSAINVALDLIELQKDVPGTRISWGTRTGGIERVLGGGRNDELPARGQLGLAAARAVKSGRLAMFSDFAVQRIAAQSGGLDVIAEHGGAEVRLKVDRVIAATGFRPDFAPMRELRLSLDPVLEATPPLAPLIDPNVHSCGTVPPHGVDELSHPEENFFVVGMKSYGRAPTFLMATGYEQVRSVVSELAGDAVAARQVHLVLPETGICNAAPASSSCCGGPAAEGIDACCVKDAEAKAAGQDGCGCSAQAKSEPVQACCGMPA